MRESSRTERGVSVTGHFGEGLVELVGDGLELLHLVDQLVLEPVDLLLELLDGLLGELGAGLSLEGKIARLKAGSQIFSCELDFRECF